MSPSGCSLTAYEEAKVDPAQWIRSSYSDGGGGNCVEWAPAHASLGSVPVRDSKDVGRGQLSFSCAAWASFVAEVQGERFGLRR